MLLLVELNETFSRFSLPPRVVCKSGGRLDLAPEFLLLSLQRTGIEAQLLAVLKVPDHEPEQSERGGSAC